MEEHFKKWRSRHKSETQAQNPFTRALAIRYLIIGAVMGGVLGLLPMDYVIFELNQIANFIYDLLFNLLLKAPILLIVGIIVVVFKGSNKARIILLPIFALILFKYGLVVDYLDQAFFFLLQVIFNGLAWVVYLLFGSPVIGLISGAGMAISVFLLKKQKFEKEGRDNGFSARIAP